jgi:hypothetical protein
MGIRHPTPVSSCTQVARSQACSRELVAVAGCISMHDSRVVRLCLADGKRELDFTVRMSPLDRSGTVSYSSSRRRRDNVVHTSSASAYFARLI